MASIQFNIWAVLILIGAAQGFFLAGIFWYKKNNQKANKLFALLLGSIALHLLEYAFCVSGVILQIPHLLFTTYPLFFVIGPLFYFYVKTYLQSDFSFTNKTLLHLLPALLVAGMLIPFYQLSGSEKVDFFVGVTQNGFKEIPPTQFAIMFGQVLQILLYLFFAYRLIRQKKESIRAKKMNGKLLKINWLQKATTAFASFVIFYAIVTFCLVFTDSLQVEFDYAVVLLLAILIYAIGYVALNQPALFSEKFSNGRQKLVLKPQNVLPFKSRLVDYMQLQQPHLKEHLKLEDLAVALDLPAHQLSELINQEFACSFFDFVNTYRVEEAKRLLVSEAAKSKKILAIAFESGFGNKATFNRVFKDFTGQTPSAYRKGQLSTKI